MSNRYEVLKDTWENDNHDDEPYVYHTYDDETGETTVHTIQVQSATLRDTRTGTEYRQGAYRILHDGKPIKGKGGTHPFIGETAWSDCSRAFGDKCWEIRRNASLVY